MEASFSKQLYLLYKSFDFRTLWDETGRLTGFERTAREAVGAGQLQGVVQLNNALLEIDDLESRARQCFTRFPATNDNVHKWSFDSVNDPAVCVICDFGKIIGSIIKRFSEQVLNF